MLPFYHIYLQYRQDNNAVEHFLLAFLRWQDAPSNESSGSFGSEPGSASSLRLPTRLKDWIRSFATMFPNPATGQDRHQPRRGTHTRTCGQCAAECPHIYTQSYQERYQLGDAYCRCDRVLPKCIYLVPWLGASCSTDPQVDPTLPGQFKKRMDLLPNFQPHTGVASSNASIVSSATESSVGDSPTDYFGLSELALAGKERFRTLPTSNVVNSKRWDSGV